MRGDLMGKQADHPGVIRADELYVKAELQARLGIGESAWRAARRNGLPVRRLGNLRFVLGEDLIEYVREKGNLE